VRSLDFFNFFWAFFLFRPINLFLCPCRNLATPFLLFGFSLFLSLMTFGFLFSGCLILAPSPFFLSPFFCTFLLYLFHGSSIRSFFPCPRHWSRRCTSFEAGSFFFFFLPFFFFLHYPLFLTKFIFLDTGVFLSVKLTLRKTSPVFTPPTVSSRRTFMFFFFYIGFHCS